MLIVIEKRILRATAALAMLAALLSVLPTRDAVLTVSAPEMPKAAVVVIDPGHGGEDGGAVAADGTKESELNLAIALRLEQLCFLAGIDTVMTRTEDVSIHTGGDTIRARKASDIRARVELVNAQECAALISIHQNALPQAKSVHGAQVFYAADEKSQVLASFMQRRLNETVNTDRAKECRKIDSSVYLMKHAQCPAVLLECGFLSNEGETALLKTDSHQKKIALTALSGYLAWSSSGEEGV